MYVRPNNAEVNLRVSGDTRNKKLLVEIELVRKISVLYHL